MRSPHADSPDHSVQNAHPEPLPDRAKWLALLAACLGLFMLYVDLFIVNVALPAIGRDFHAAVSTVSWTVTGYVLVIGVLPMGVGRLGDLWGYRRVYLAGLALFVVASFACGLAPSVLALIVCRVLQGVGAALMTPTTLAIVTRAFPVGQRGLALGVYGGISSLGLVAGPLLGGLLVNSASWRWVFFINIPIGVLAIALTLLFVQDVRGATGAERVDWLGLALLSFGILGLLLALTRNALDVWTIVLVGGGLALFAIFVRVERRSPWPLIDLSVFRNRAFVGVSVSFLLFSAALFGSQPYWSLFLQNTWGLTPLQGGLAFLPATALIAVLTPASGLIGQWAGARVSQVAAIGAGVMGLGYAAVAVLLSAHSTYLNTFLPVFLLRGLGIPVFVTCAQLAMLAAVPSSQVGLASGTLGMARNVGTAFGVALLGGVYIQSLQHTVSGSLRAGAGQFRVTGPAAAHASAISAILQSFNALNLAAALCCALAVVALLVIRVKTAPASTQPAPSAASPVPAAR